MALVVAAMRVPPQILPLPPPTGGHLIVRRAGPRVNCADRRRKGRNPRPAGAGRRRARSAGPGPWVPSVASGGEAMIRCIVAGTDDSPTARVAVREAVTLARDLGARLH